MLEIAWETQCHAAVYKTVVFALFHTHINMLIDILLITLGVICIEIFFLL